jgi:hypothetical protein
MEEKNEKQGIRVQPMAKLPAIFLRSTVLCLLPSCQLQSPAHKEGLQATSCKLYIIHPNLSIRLKKYTVFIQFSLFFGFLSFSH